MTPETVAKLRDNIYAPGRDSQRLPIFLNQLYEDVLRDISNGNPDAKSLASAALDIKKPERKPPMGLILGAGGRAFGPY